MSVRLRDLGMKGCIILENSFALFNLKIFKYSQDKVVSASKELGYVPRNQLLNSIEIAVYEEHTRVLYMVPEICSPRTK